MLNHFSQDEKLCLLFSIVWICIIPGKVDGTVWREVTACYGADIHCSWYHMECDGGTKIVVGTLLYGVKKANPICQQGISDCAKKEDVSECCTYNSRDILLPFSANHTSDVLRKCEGQKTCAGQAPRLNSTPTSSYVLVKYACVSDKNITDMCHVKRIVGTDLFLRFNISSSGFKNSLSLPLDCNCRVSTADCNATMTTTLVDLDFHTPQLDTSNVKDTSLSACSSASLEFVNENKGYNCASTDLSTGGQTFQRMTEVSLRSPNEIVALKNINSNGVRGPSYVVLYFRAVPRQPLLVNCFEPGKEVSLSNNCRWTTPEQTPTLPGGKSTSDYSMSNKTNTVLSSTAASTVSSVSSPKPSTTNQSAGGILSTSSSRSFTKTVSTIFSASNPTLSTTNQSAGGILSTSSSKSLTKTVSTISSAFNPTLSTTNQSAGGILSTSSSVSSPPITESKMPPTTPSKDLLSIYSSSTVRPQTIPVTTTVSSRPGQKTALTTTDTIKYPSTTYLHHLHQNNSSIETANKVSKTNKIPSQVGLFSSGSTPTSMLSSTDKQNTTPDLTYLRPFSISKPINSRTNTLNTTKEHQNENTNGEGTTSLGGSSTQSATTGKPTDDSGSDSGLIIGITVAVILVILIIVAVIMFTLCIRIKRKEKVRRNYIRNTNIFYSFPEDYADTGSTQSDNAPEVDREDSSFPNMPRSQLYEDIKDFSTATVHKSASAPLYFDQYKIKSLRNEEMKSNFNSTRRNDNNNHVGETTTETIVFVNGVENDEVAKEDPGAESGGKAVTFDPNVLYAQVKKEGRTKF